MAKWIGHWTRKIRRSGVAYEQCGNWRMATCMATELGQSAAEKEQLVRRMVGTLVMCTVTCHCLFNRNH